MTTLEARYPSGGDWRRVATPRGLILGTTAWASGEVRVLSSLGDLELPGGDGRVGPTWHVSITRRGKRPRDTDVRRALRAFGLVGAEEDNHSPGNARHFFQPVDPAFRGVCECKATEVQMSDPDGYRWSQATDPASCSTCQLHALLGRRPCPLHPSPSLSRGSL